MTRFRSGGLALLIGALALAASPPVAQGETMKPDSMSGAPPVDSVVIAAPTSIDVLTFTLVREDSAAIAVQLSRNSLRAVSRDSVVSDSVTVTRTVQAERRAWRNERTAIDSTSSMLHARTVDNPTAPAERMRSATASAASNPATYRTTRTIGQDACPLYL